MAKRNNGSVIGKYLFPPVLVLGGILALWENEGRFDYYAAARDATVIEVPALRETGSLLLESPATPVPAVTLPSPPDTTVAVTAALHTGIPIADEYVEPMVGYHVVSRRAEIYSWREKRDDDGVTWREGWYEHLQKNARNGDLRQTLHSARLYPPRYQLGALPIAPARIHFADAEEEIPVASLALSEAGRGHGLVVRDGYLHKGEGGDRLGDERLGYTGIPNAPTASYFGRVSDGVAVGKQHAISRSWISGMIGNDGILHHLVNGERERALRTIQSDFQRLKWMVRGGGTAAIVFGIFLFFSLFVNLLYGIPVLGSLVRSGVLLVSVLTGSAIALLVIFASLAVHNPLVVVVPVALVVAAVVLIRRRAGATRANVKATLRAHGATAAADGGAMSDREIAEQTFSNLMKLAFADGSLDDSEKKFLVDWGGKSGISKQRMKELIDRVAHDSNEMRAARREDVVLLAALAMADGTLSTREMKRLVGVGRSVGLSAADVRAILVELESGVPAPVAA